MSNWRLILEKLWTISTQRFKTLRNPIFLLWMKFQGWRKENCLFLTEKTLMRSQLSDLRLKRSTQKQSLQRFLLWIWIKLKSGERKSTWLLFSERRDRKTTLFKRTLIDWLSMILLQLIQVKRKTFSEDLHSIQKPQLIKRECWYWDKEKRKLSTCLTQLLLKSQILLTKEEKRSLNMWRLSTSKMKTLILFVTGSKCRKNQNDSLLKKNNRKRNQDNYFMWILWMN